MTMVSRKMPRTLMMTQASNMIRPTAARPDLSLTKSNRGLIGSQPLLRNYYPTKSSHKSKSCISRGENPREFLTTAGVGDLPAPPGNCKQISSQRTLLPPGLLTLSTGERGGDVEVALTQDREGRTTGKYYQMSVSGILHVRVSNSFVRIADRIESHQNHPAPGYS